MTARPEKTIDGLPRFEVSAIALIDSSEKQYELSGSVDQVTKIEEGKCYLLTDGDVLAALVGTLKFSDQDLGTATFKTFEKSMPEVVGTKLIYLASKHDPLHVWMVAKPQWKWNQEQFQALDAVFRRIEDEKVSIVDGEEVKEWIEIKPVGGGPLSRYYPIFLSGRPTLPPPGTDGIIKGGWDHTHCELCNAHIHAGSEAYIDPGGHWVCEQCYDKYVVNHDLSFLGR